MPYPRKGSRYWWAKYTSASGAKIRRSTGTADKREAQALESKWRLDAYRQSQWGEAPKYTFDELILDYLEQTASKKSHERDLYAAKRLHEVFAGRELASITAQDINDYKRLRGRAVKTNTIIKELNTLSAAINYARTEWGWHVANVVEKRVPAAPQGKLRWLTQDEAARLVEAARSSRRAPYLAEFILLALHTGMRRGELLGLEWGRVDLAQRLIYLAPDDQKSGQHGSVPLNDPAVQALNVLWGQHHRWVFPYRGKRLLSVKRSFATACRRSGLTDCTVHTLRHTTAAWMVQSGIPIRVVCEVLRHSDIRTTMRYAHLSPESTRSGVDALAVYQNVPETGQTVPLKGTFGHFLTNQNS